MGTHDGGEGIQVTEIDYGEISIDIEGLIQANTTRAQQATDQVRVTQRPIPDQRYIPGEKSFFSILHLEIQYNRSEID
jgi:hypothetical protein